MWFYNLFWQILKSFLKIVIDFYQNQPQNPKSGKHLRILLHAENQQNDSKNWPIHLTISSLCHPPWSDVKMDPKIVF